MKRSVVAILPLLVCCALLRFAVAQSGPSSEKAELKALDGYAGTWEIELTIKYADQPEAIKRSGRCIGEWIHNGHFMRQTWTVDASGDMPEVTGSSIRTYDDRQKAYRTWSFDSSGTVEESQGTWDDEARTITWTARENTLGGQTVTQSKFSDDHESWSIVVKDGDGQVVAEFNGKSVRRNK
jgi:hypothetical protein